MTLPEVLIAAFITLLLVGMVTQAVVMSWQRVQTGQAQLNYQMNARFGTERIVRAVLNARAVSIYEDGLGVFILDDDNSVQAFYFADADDNPDTTRDNAIWYDPDPQVGGDEQIVLTHVSELATGTPMFSRVGNGVQIAYQVGDPANRSAAADRFSGPGHQGLPVRVVAKPRNVVRVWTLNPDE